MEETLIELLERRFVTADNVIVWNEQVKGLINSALSSRDIPTQQRFAEYCSNADWVWSEKSKVWFCENDQRPDHTTGELYQVFLLTEGKLGKGGQEEKKVACPVCGGKGKVPHGFYSTHGQGSTSDIADKPCRTCNGTGII